MQPRVIVCISSGFELGKSQEENVVGSFNPPVSRQGDPEPVDRFSVLPVCALLDQEIVVFHKLDFLGRAKQLEVEFFPEFFIGSDIFAHQSDCCFSYSFGIQLCMIQCIEVLPDKRADRIQWDFMFHVPGGVGREPRGPVAEPVTPPPDFQ